MRDTHILFFFFFFFKKDMAKRGDMSKRRNALVLRIGEKRILLFSLSRYQRSLKRLEQVAN